MTWLLLAAAVAVVVGGARAAVRPTGVEVNHVVLFSFGIAFYWILPIAAGMLRILADQPGLALWYATWDAAAQSGALTGFVAFTLVTYGSFLAGDWVGRRARLPDAAGERELPRDARLLRLFLPLALAIVVLYAWSLRSELFSGYRFVDSPATGARGTLSAASLLVLVLCLLRRAESAGWPQRFAGWRGVVTDPFIAAYAASAVLVLSLGGRLYVVSAIIMAVVYYTVYRRPLPLGRTVAIVVGAMLLSGVVGTLRMGSAPSPLGVLINLLAEPLFTGFSLLHFLAHNDPPWITAPLLLLSDLVNLVPTAVLPTKAEYLLDPVDFGYSIFSPLGALNSYVSLTINFGTIGTPVVIFALGACLAVLRRRRTALARVMYTMLSGWLAFTFFRDEFSVSVVKNMLEFSVLIPMLIVWSAHVMTVIAPRRAAPPVAPAGS